MLLIAYLRNVIGELIAGLLMSWIRGTPKCVRILDNRASTFALSLL